MYTQYCINIIRICVKMQCNEIEENKKLKAQILGLILSYLFLNEQTFNKCIKKLNRIHILI